MPFFHQLIPRLAEDGIDCRVAIPRVPLTQADRGDSEDAQWTIAGKGRSVRVRGRSISMYGSSSARRGADAVITGLASTSLDTWAALYGSFTRRVPVGLWGHVRSYVNPSTKVDRCLKQHQVHRAHHVFAYTPSGVLQAEAWGLPTAKVTCVMNTVDTRPLTAARAGLGREHVSGFQDGYHLTPGRTSAFIGGLDASKRIAFLADVLEHIWTVQPDFKLLLGGRGHSLSLLARAISRGQVVALGQVNARDKALMAACASTMCMPGRIGLVAVDALALGLPIVTTDWRYHAPEADYLEEGLSRFTSADDPFSFASLLLRRTEALGSKSPTFSYPAMSDMVDRFVGGVRTMLNSTDVHEVNRM